MNQIAAAATTTAWQATEYFRHATTPTACTTSSRPSLGFGLPENRCQVVWDKVSDVECGYRAKTSGSGCNLGEDNDVVVLWISPSTNYILTAAIRVTVPAVTLRLSKASNEGYAKYNGTPFKVSTLNRRIVFIGRRYLGDIKESTDDGLSLIEAANDLEEALIGKCSNSLPRLTL
ncbi:hypothetical protein BKA83DRAFT_4128534 [Pisolithus microcarpus]|nr:hypothetical protein BKA83DRAFT_4128534 [Pisolithus microcarpus]